MTKIETAFRTFLVMSGLVLQVGASAADFPARYCEIFVDKVVPENKEIGVRGDPFPHQDLHFYIKVRLEALDSPVQTVGFYGFNPIVGQWQTSEAERFLNSSNYYDVLIHTSLNSAPVQTDGSFFVKTQNGTVLWSNADDSGKNFSFSPNTYRLVSNTIPIYNVGRMLSPSLNELPKTADVFPELNPKVCR